MSDINEVNSDILNAFDEIIATLSDESVNYKTIEQQFLILFGQIADLEESDKPLYYSYRHRYHTLRVSYFRRINNNDKVIKEEEMLSKYAALCERFSLSEVAVLSRTLQEVCNNNEENSDYIVVSSWDDIHKQIATLSDLVDVDQIINALALIRKSLEPLFQCEIRTMDELQTLQQNCTSILSAFDALKIGEVHEAIDNDESNLNYLNFIIESIDFVTNNLENRQASFVDILLSDISQLEKLLFHDVPPTEQCITRRYREWARIFHSDKHRSNPIFSELMKNINIIRDRYISKINTHLASVERVQAELDIGHKHYEFSRAYKKRAERGNDPDFTTAHLRRLVANEALWAFEHYRAALKSLGRMKKQNSETDILQRVEILTYMGLMMRQAGTYQIEAQLYIVAGIYIITLTTITPRLQQKLGELQSTLKRYQQTSTSTSPTARDSRSTNATSRELILCTDTTATTQQIHEETQVFVREIILRQCIVRSGQPADLSIDISQRTLEEETFRTLNSRSRMILPILTGSAVTVAGSFTTYYVTKLLHKLNLVRRRQKPSFKDLTPEYVIRETLNEMMKSVVDHYNNGQYAQFIECLAKPYYHSRRLMVVTRGSETISVEIRVDQFIEPLLKHDFRADKIAHLLVIIGEVFLRGLDFADPILKNPEYTALLEQSKILFQGVYDTEALRDAARELDKRVERYHHAILSKCAPKLLHGISARDITDSQSSPFISRLDGYCRLARLNYAIACLLAAGKTIHWQFCNKKLFFNHCDQPV
ncbi:unnamed protein product [Rotaria sp. Silwood1]|nr:unnamed protein product [Rotaria sp. Silwood1]